MVKKQSILISGGAGFIGSHLVLHMIENYSHYHIVNVDSLTYAADLTVLTHISQHKNYSFIKADITDRSAVQEIFEKQPIDHVIHLAAESHVDNSIENPAVFAKTNIMGTLNLLQAAQENWLDNRSHHRFYHISTDEVLEALARQELFRKAHHMIHAPLIQPPKPALIILLGPITILMSFHTDFLLFQ